MPPPFFKQFARIRRDRVSRIICLPWRASPPMRCLTGLSIGHGNTRECCGTRPRSGSHFPCSRHDEGGPTRRETTLFVHCGTPSPSTTHGEKRGRNVPGRHIQKIDRRTTTTICCRRCTLQPLSYTALTVSSVVCISLTKTQPGASPAVNRGPRIWPRVAIPSASTAPCTGVIVALFLPGSVYHDFEVCTCVCTPEIPSAQETRLRRSMGGFEPRLLVLYATGHHASPYNYVLNIQQ